MDIMGYLYYRGLLFTGLKRYEEALDSFMLVLALPAQITHKVHTESYKKLIILNLLTRGKGVNFPSYIGQMMKIKLENTF